MPHLDNTDAPFGNMPALRVGARLSEQLADALAVNIRDGQLSAGQKLPTKQALAAARRTQQSVKQKLRDTA